MRENQSERKGADMVLNIIDKIKVGNNTSVTISGTHEKLKNGSVIKDENNKEFVVLSVAMVETIGKVSDETTLLIKGTGKIGTKIHI